MKKTRKKYPLNYNDPNFYMKRFLRMHSDKGIKESLCTRGLLLGRNGQIGPALNVSSGNYHKPPESMGSKDVLWETAQK